MKAISIPLLLAASAAAGLSFLPAAPAPAAASAEALTYVIDGVHSSVLFRIEHMGVGQNWGRFNDISGSIDYDPENPASSSIQVEVDAASVDTANEKRDGHLKSGDFFSVKEFPTIAFESTKVEGRGDDLKVTGNLTLHGVTKPVTAAVTHVAHGTDPGGNAMVGLEARFGIKRSEFGMSYGIENGGAGDQVDLIVSFEAKHQK